MSPRNKLLEPFSVLIGNWTTEGTHPMLPGRTLRGHCSFEWAQDGAFLMMRSEMFDPEVPKGVAITGSDDTTKLNVMIYFDERGVSRHYQVAMKDNVWTWKRDSPEFSQRFRGTISADGNTIVSTGELSKDGKTWEGDLALTYTRVS